MAAFCTAHTVSMNQVRARGCWAGGLRMLRRAEALALAARRSMSTRLHTVRFSILDLSFCVSVPTVQKGSLWSRRQQGL